jgi:hypothetical protein
MRRSSADGGPARARAAREGAASDRAPGWRVRLVGVRRVRALPAALPRRPDHGLQRLRLAGAAPSLLSPTARPY